MALAERMGHRSVVAQLRAITPAPAVLPGPGVPAAASAAGKAQKPNERCACGSVRARPERLREFRVFLYRSVVYGGFGSARGALNRSKRRFLAPVPPPVWYTIY